MRTAFLIIDMSNGIEDHTMHFNIANQNISNDVKLDIGGSRFRTSIDTLTKGDNMLSAMFSGRMPIAKDEDGFVFIDRCGKPFGIILNFLRNGTTVLPDNRRELLELKEEASFYCIDDLVAAVDAGLARYDATHMMSDKDVEDVLVRGCSTCYRYGL